MHYKIGVAHDWNDVYRTQGQINMLENQNKPELEELILII